jgi:hypothetical protein
VECIVALLYNGNITVTFCTTESPNVEMLIITWLREN